MQLIEGGERQKDKGESLEKTLQRSRWKPQCSFEWIERERERGAERTNKVIIHPGTFIDKGFTHHYSAEHLRQIFLGHSFFSRFLLFFLPSSVFTISVVFPERCEIRYAPDLLLMNLWWIYIVTLLTFRWQTIRSEVPRCRSPFRKISVISGVFLGAKRTDGDNSPSMEIQRSKCTPDPADMVLKSKRLGEWDLTKMETHNLWWRLYSKPPLSLPPKLWPQSGPNSPEQNQRV